MDTMYVPVFKGDGELAYEDRPIPEPEHRDDVLIRVEACGICGTDLNILATPPAHKATLNIIIGHEGVSLVEDVGSGVTGLRPGDRVVIAPRLTCGHCPYCRRGLDNQCDNYETIGTTIDGAFAPYLRAPQSAPFKISGWCPTYDVARDDAALFEPLSGGVPPTSSGRWRAFRFKPAITWPSSARGQWVCSSPKCIRRWGPAR